MVMAIKNRPEAVNKACTIMQMVYDRCLELHQESFEYQHLGYRQ